MKKLYRKASLAYYKYREITIFVLCLLIVGVFGFCVLEVVIERNPYLSLVGVFFLLFLYFAGKKFNNKNL